MAINSKFGNDEKSSGRCVCSATINIRSDRVIFTTKNVSSRATGSGSTSIATRAIMPKGKKVLTSLGETLIIPMLCNFSIVHL